MFNLSPSHQFMLSHALQSLSGQPTSSQSNTGLGGIASIIHAMPSFLHRPQGNPMSAQSAPAQPALPMGNNAPGIMNRYRSMIANRLPPQMQSPAANAMMPPQY